MCNHTYQLFFDQIDFITVNMMWKYFHLVSLLASPGGREEREADTTSCPPPPWPTGEQSQVSATVVFYHGATCAALKRTEFHRKKDLHIIAKLEL